MNFLIWVAIGYAALLGVELILFIRVYRQYFKDLIEILKRGDDEKSL